MYFQHFDILYNNVNINLFVKNLLLYVAFIHFNVSTAFVFKCSGMYSWMLLTLASQITKLIVLNFSFSIWSKKAKWKNSPQSYIKRTEIRFPLVFSTFLLLRLSFALYLALIGFFAIKLLQITLCAVFLLFHNSSFLILTTTL